jgi:O-methyltransferase involved in polyketide biosynthesis
MKVGGALPAGSGVVFDYMTAMAGLGLLEKIGSAYLSYRVASTGEPFRLFFEPRELAAKVSGSGFTRTEDFAPREITDRYFRDRADGL